MRSSTSATRRKTDSRNFAGGDFFADEHFMKLAGGQLVQLHSTLWVMGFYFPQSSLFDNFGNAEEPAIRSGALLRVRSWEMEGATESSRKTFVLATA